MDGELDEETVRLVEEVARRLDVSPDALIRTALIALLEARGDDESAT